MGTRSKGISHSSRVTTPGRMPPKRRAAWLRRQAGRKSGAFTEGFEMLLALRSGERALGRENVPIDDAFMLSNPDLTLGKVRPFALVSGSSTIANRRRRDRQRRA